ncbi:MAG: DUF1839 family protein [Usitatibacter sp.]
MSSISAETRRARVVPLDAAGYKRHRIHGEDRVWAETNCYTDLVVELVHGLRREPVAMLPFTLAVDFEGDQWTFFKPPHSDLLELYGLDVQELAIWRTLLDHVVEQVGAGRPVLVELDSFYLPDTAGTAYGLAHQKTTVGVNEIDPEAGFMGYFHNQGYFEVAGDDFAELFLRSGAPHERVLPPYVEVVKIVPGFPPPRGAALVDASLAAMKRQLSRAPRDNPFPRFKARFEADLDSLLASDIAHFHKYSFATLRQYGACFELARTYLGWLGEQGVAGLEVPAAAFGQIAETAKAFQFQLARSMARKKPLDLAPLDAMGAQWEVGMTLLRSRYA